jgi:hypothetical protein
MGKYHFLVFFIYLCKKMVKELKRPSRKRPCTFRKKRTVKSLNLCTTKIRRFWRTKEFFLHLRIGTHFCPVKHHGQTPHWYLAPVCTVQTKLFSTSPVAPIAGFHSYICNYSERITENRCLDWNIFIVQDRCFV